MNPFLFKTIMVLSVIFCFSVFGCSRDKDRTFVDFKRTELEKVVFHGYEIPKFPTAQDQLNYARSGFPDVNEKRAALNFIAELFPGERRVCGNAALNLAYMNFGSDYRFALQLDYHSAVKDYLKIISDFQDQPEVLVKANWYLGWIYCDLLDDVASGLKYYWKIVDAYPDREMGISSPVPWVSLVYNQPVNDRLPENQKQTQCRWADLSLLEIVRHTSDSRESLQAFERLWGEYRDSLTTGFAIKLLLEDKAHQKKILPFAKQYLDTHFSNTYLMAEIDALVKETAL